MFRSPLHFLEASGKTLVALLGLVLAADAALRAQDPPATAWQALLAERPEAADDTSISTPERKILQVLTPEQADAYANGRDATEILLPSDETLAEFIDRTERARAAGLVIRPLEPCTLLDTRSVSKLTAGERRTVQVRGPKTDYSAQGGAADGCGVPGLVGEALKVNAARAVLLAVEVHEAEGTGELALWPSHGPPAPRTGLVSYGPESPVTVPSLIVPLCHEESVEPCRDGDLELRLDGAGANVVLTVHGVLEPAIATIDAADSEAAGVPNKSTTAPYWEKRTDNDNLYYTDGFVGIGTSAPGELVHIYGGNLRLTNLGGDVELQFFSSSGGGSTKIVKRGLDNALRIRRMDDTDLYYLGQGHFIVYKAKLGLGATPPKSRLDVRSAGGEDVQITVSDDEGSDNAQMGYSNDKNEFAIHQNAAGGQSSFLIKYAASGDLPVFQFDTNTTPGAMVVTENGNLKLSGNIVSDGDICIGNCQ